MTNPSPQGGETPTPISDSASIWCQPTDVLRTKTDAQNAFVPYEVSAAIEKKLARVTQENEELKRAVAQGCVGGGVILERDRLRALLGEAQAYLAARNLGEPAQKLLTRLNAELGEGAKRKTSSDEVGHDWVKCPICGESDMERTFHGEERDPIIHCCNHECASNGGSNREQLDAAPSPTSGMSGGEPTLKVYEACLNWDGTGDYRMEVVSLADHKQALQRAEERIRSLGGGPGSDLQPERPTSAQKPS